MTVTGQKYKVVFFGTHPLQFNGYSKVIYELSKHLSEHDDLELIIYGFQNFHHNPKYRLDIPKNVKVYDAFANEQPKANGFGVRQVVDFITLVDPDICIVYNDMVVTTAVVTELKSIPNHRFKIIGYIDQVYLNQKKPYINFINKNIDVSILFTQTWMENIVEQGVTTPVHFLPHGFNPMTYFPIPKDIARQYFSLSADDFIILNLNKNQPRKRWDICLKAFADIVSRFPQEPIKMIIGTSLQGEWNLIEMYERELKKRNVSFEVGMKHIILLDNPHKNTDEETNILYNTADIGINTCDGEGFGLCNFEQAGVGIPQIVSKLGGFIDIFEDDNALLMDPQMAYYVGTSRDNVGGEALLVSYMDVADAIETYYKDKSLREKHGLNARQKVLRDFQWKDISQKLKKIMDDIVISQSEKKKPMDSKDDLDYLLQQVDKANDSQIDSKIVDSNMDSNMDLNMNLNMNSNELKQESNKELKQEIKSTKKETIDTESLDILVQSMKKEKIEGKEKKKEERKEEKKEEEEESETGKKKEKEKGKEKEKENEKRKSMKKKQKRIIKMQEILELQKKIDDLAKMMRHENKHKKDSDSSSDSNSNSDSNSDSDSDSESRVYPDSVKGHMVSCSNANV